jgi:hypothetical protein
LNSQLLKSEEPVYPDGTAPLKLESVKTIPTGVALAGDGTPANAMTPTTTPIR